MLSQGEYIKKGMKITQPSGIRLYYMFILPQHTHIKVVKKKVTIFKSDADDLNFLFIAFVLCPCENILGGIALMQIR